ncbi:MAG: hypothetical protein WCK02_02610 [Bacteroidota bacterium]
MKKEPLFDTTNINVYPLAYEEFYNDNFPLRSRYIKLFNSFNLNILDKSPVPDQVIIGKEGWLYFANEELDIYKGKNRFSEKELEEFRLELDYRTNYLEKLGIKYYFMVAPSKSTIYPEYMPVSVVQENKESWGEQLINYLNKKSVVKTINVYTTLRANSKKENLYYKIDNHWNMLGGFYGANEIIRVMKKDFPQLSTHKLSEYSIKKEQIKEGNLSKMFSGSGNFRDVRCFFTPKKGRKAVEVAKKYPVIKNFSMINDYEKTMEIKDSHKPKILIITDSFGAHAYEFLSEEFSRSVKIFDAWNYMLNEDIVLKEKPDIVLLISFEPRLRYLLKNQSRLKNIEKK